MTRSHICSALTFAACVYTAAGAYDSSTQPNIVFVLADDMGLGDVGYNKDIATRGYIPTDIIDGLADDGIKLQRFYTNNLCTPSRASLLTGRFASRTNMKSPLSEAGNVVALNEDEQLLSEILKDLDYQTHLVGKWHMGMHERKYTPIGRGFDSFCGSLAGTIDYFYHAAQPNANYAPHDLGCSWMDDNTSSMATCDTVPDDGYYADDDMSVQRYELDFAQPSSESETPDEATYGDYYMTNIYGGKAVEVIENHDSAEGPLFLLTTFTAPHTPKQALAEDIAKCDPDITGITDEDRLVFCGMVMSMDENIGYMVDALEDKGLWQNTVFIFAADHGGQSSGSGGADNADLRGTKASFYEGGLRAPAFIRFGRDTVSRPSRTRGKENTQPIHLVDLFRTIVAAGTLDGDSVSFDNDIDGRNLWPQLKEGNNIPSSKSDVNFNYAAGAGFASYINQDNVNEDGSSVEAVMVTYGDAEYKLCRNCIGYTLDEVFDVTNDPYETTDLSTSEDYADVYALLNDTLSDWVDVSYPDEDNPTRADTIASLLVGAGLSPTLTYGLVNNQKCNLPYDSPEFLCTDCSATLQSFPDTTATV